MEGFSYHHHPFLLDSGFFLNPPMEFTTSSSHLFKSHSNPQGILVDASINESNNSCLENVMNHVTSNNEASLTTIKQISVDSSSVVAKVETGEQITQKVRVTRVHNGRKYRDDSPLNSANSKDSRAVRTQRPKKCNGGRSEIEEKKHRDATDKKDQKKVAAEEAPTGYIHVRARRGQATDSHSLAERVRREKISERMKQLQALVPGCDKVTGKAHMLDEIINYVQSLQNQVEFLSLKLAAVNPIIYDFGMDLDGFMATPERLLSSVASMPTQSTVFPDASNSFSTSTHPLTDTSSSLLFQHGHMTVTFPQGDRQQQQQQQNLWCMDGQRQDFLNQFDCNNLYSFH